MTQNLLVELLVEELPPKSLQMLGNSFAELLVSGLAAQELVGKDANQGQIFTLDGRDPCRPELNSLK